MKTNTIALSHAQPGCIACIHSISDLDSLVCRRLLDLGITVGSEIRMKRKSLFGGPLTLESNGQLFGIRKQEAAKIEVQIR
ncbi:hypothetical protein BVG16_16775 [Paenibacillus selenitireducens]|uniref:Ferrous iron transporter FeoA-like domain-containing protein n=1 Tax=Paenibacillus selenitireducens TaxID=1324314 RepID=A0A1T2XB27_9BACL|nr:FeoA family protein [Paenibacillus selenitireducens]OPA76813.1 hypothetical protein BVG16_16775 [Paenibacillus selenitireducens]